MATFLQLCQAVARESGTLDASQPAAVTGQTGRLQKIVSWVSDAWVEIQNSRNAWAFMRKEFTGSLVINQARYTAGNFTITDHAEWVGDVTLHTNGSNADEGPLSLISWQEWKSKFDRGEQFSQRPIHYAVSPDNKLCFGPIPDAVYTVRGEYIKTAQVLAANGDVPGIPDRFHNTIVWKALVALAEHDEANLHLVTWRNKYKECLFALERDQIRNRISIGGGPLA